MKNMKESVVGKIILAVVGLIVAVVLIRYLPTIVKLSVSIDEFRNYILASGKMGPLLFIFFQMLQTVIAPIPGEVIQIAGGYIYGTTLGTVYNTVGLLLGAMIAFYFTRFIGRSYVEKLMQKKKFQWMANLLEHKRFPVFLFIVFVIPGFPKDMFIYAAGLAPIRPLQFFIILLVSRFPWLLASVSVGSNIYQKNYVATIIISVVAVAAFIIGIATKDKWIQKVSESKKAWKNLK